MAAQVNEGRLWFHPHGDYFIVSLSYRDEHEGKNVVVGYRVKGPDGYARDFPTDQLDAAKADCEAQSLNRSGKLFRRF